MHFTSHRLSWWAWSVPRWPLPLLQCTRLTEWLDEDDNHVKYVSLQSPDLSPGEQLWEILGSVSTTTPITNLWKNGVHLFSTIPQTCRFCQAVLATCIVPPPRPFNSSTFRADPETALPIQLLKHNDDREHHKSEVRSALYLVRGALISSFRWSGHDAVRPRSHAKLRFAAKTRMGILLQIYWQFP